MLTTATYPNPSQARGVGLTGCWSSEKATTGTRNGEASTKAHEITRQPPISRASAPPSAKPGAPSSTARSTSASAGCGHPAPWTAAKPRTAMSPKREASQNPRDGRSPARRTDRTAVAAGNNSNDDGAVYCRQVMKRQGGEQWEADHYPDRDQR